jgi:two-component system sensor histidine kinase YesM
MNSTDTINKNKIQTRNSLSLRLRLVFAIIIFLFIIAFIVSIYLITKKERRENVIIESESLLTGLSDGIYSDIQRYRELSRLVMIDDRLVKFLRAKTEDVSPGLINTARYGVLGVLNITTMVDSVFVFRNDGQYMATNRGKYMLNYIRMDDDEWKNKIVEKKGRAFVTLNGDGAIYKTNLSPIITISRAINDVVSQERTGILLMNISSVLLEQKVYALNTKDIIIVGTDGTFLAGNENLVGYFDENLIAPDFVHIEKFIDNEDIMISGMQVPDMPIVVMAVTHIHKGMVSTETIGVLIFLMLVFIAGVFFVGAYITKNITSPVFDLVKDMEKNREEGTLKKIDTNINVNELILIEDSYNNMVDHVNVLFDRLIEKEQTIQKAELRVLQEQIKPHFLYNSLETIGFLAIDAGADKVHSALETLGSFYRNFLSKGDREIPLKREITIIKDYLSLQKLRYGDILNDEYEIAPDTEECLIPKLILQPLVENSIYHGIRMKGEQGTIKISSFLEDDDLHILVRDTGIGMTQEQIDKVLSKEKNEGTEEFNESFGLWGTIERIRCYCDKDDVVRIRSEIGEYTEIEFILGLQPKRWKPTAD